MRGFSRVFYVSLILFSAPASAGSEAVAASPAWLRLLHYHRHFGGYKSDLDGPGFFFAPDGRTNPQAELKASARAFTQDIRVGNPPQNPQCAFPERYRFLKAQLGLGWSPPNGDAACPELQKFLERFGDAGSISLVFSSAYPDNPASMFGHTFLRVDGKNRSPLLSMGISYAANVPADESTLLFYWKGVVGGYRGAFTIVPYYVKVNEYTAAEARDLWEYELALTPEQVQALLRHLWEIQSNSWLDYYFFDANCSLELLTLIEAVRPDWDLEKIPYWIIPGETTKVFPPNAIRDVHYRPAARRKMLARFDALATDEQKRVLDSLESGNPPKSNDRAERAVLDALDSALYYRKATATTALSEKDSHLLEKVEIERSELAPISPEIFSPAWNNRPDLGHDAGKLTLSGGLLSFQGNHPAFQELSWRTAYHDLMDDDLGYLRFSQIEFPSFTFRFYPSLLGQGDFRIERLGLLSAISLHPLHPLEKKLSWALDFDYASPKDLSDPTAHSLRLRGGAGFTKALGTPDALFYALALANFEVASALSQGYRIGPGARAGIVANPLPHYKIEIDDQFIGDLFQSTRPRHFQEARLEQSVSLSRDTEARALLRWIKGSSSASEAKLSLSVMF